jgi:hypothetical protein
MRRSFGRCWTVDWPKPSPVSRLRDFRRVIQGGDIAAEDAMEAY